MAIDNNIKHFTATDIEKYHKGLLSNLERHELEKAALDDPFLADALEGYATSGVQVETDLAELKNRLGQKIEGTKIVLLKKSSGNNLKLLRAAVLLAFVAGAGLLIYQFGFKKKSGELAQAETTKKEDVKFTDSAKTTNTPGTVPLPVSETKPVSDIKAGPTTNKKDATTYDNETKSGAGLKNAGTGETTIVTGKTTTDDVIVNKPVETQPIAPAPATVKVADEKTSGSKAETILAEKKEAAKRESNNKLKSNSQEFDKDEVRDKVSQQQHNRNDAPGRQAEEQNLRNQNQATNLFRGRVTDAANNGVPFANVTNLRDNNTGTYTDANGYFNLTYPDSVLTVQVRSVGFENNNVQLRNAVTNNQVVLQDDRKNLSEVVITNQKTTTATRSVEKNIKLEEPVPVDGWDKYATYLTNNLEIPADFKNKQTGNSQVQVSFEVDKKGAPIKMKVEKSLCAQCDKETIRLIKEGPKWKRNAKKSRATITILF